MKYAIKITCPPPPNLARKIIEAHAAAIQSATKRSMTKDSSHCDRPG